MTWNRCRSQAWGVYGKYACDYAFRGWGFLDGYIIQTYLSQFWCLFWNAKYIVDFHCHGWTEFFHGLLDSCDFYTVCCGKIQCIVCHVHLVVVSDVTFVIYMNGDFWCIWFLLCVFAGSRWLPNPNCAPGCSRKQKRPCRGLFPRWRATTKARHL